MIFVDTNVLMYAVGREHPLRAQAQEFFAQSVIKGSALVTSAEVLQELLHAYLPAGRQQTLDAALLLADSIPTVWPVERDDVLLARALAHEQPELSARDLLHLATCRRRSVRQLMTFDRDLAKAFAD